MHKLYYGNFDFERQLATGRAAPDGGVLQGMNADLSAVWVCVADDGDFIWTPAPIEPSFFEELAARGFPSVRPITDLRTMADPSALVPWGWTDNMRSCGMRYGFSFDAPAQDAVRTANSRSYSFRLEQEWEVGLAGAGVIQTPDELIRLVHGLPSAASRWIVKAEFSMAGRDRIVAAGREPTEQARKWVSKRLKQGEVLFFEPCVERVEEVGLQFTVPQIGSIVFEAAVPLLTDPYGNYCGSRFAHDASLNDRWSVAIEIGRRTALQLKQMGYFGPLGIDAMRYRTEDGMIRLRPLQDINARFTMGRLSLGLRKLLAPGETGSWLQVPLPNQPQTSVCTLLQRWKAGLSPGCQLLSMTPAAVGGRPTRRCTLIVIANSDAARDNSESLVLKGNQ